MYTHRNTFTRRQAEASQQQMAVAQAEAARQRKRADDLQQKLSQASAQITQQQVDMYGGVVLS
jgi:uncharacterized coiled-coil DUF342 family protein